jgi:hypothetical protein
LRLGHRFQVTVPDGMASGVYGVQLRGGGEQDIVPDHILPPASSTTAPLVFPRLDLHLPIHAISVGTPYPKNHILGYRWPLQFPSHP